MIIDTFAGPGGWDEGLALIGRRDVLGIEWDEAACLTAEAAGHKRVRGDVSKLNPADFAPTEGFIASPPCQAWSMAGNRKGEADRATCHTLADRMAAGDDSTDWTAWEDERSPLVCQPVRWVRELRPEWVALEEVPQVAPLWEHFARIFRGWGYSAWTGDLCAADYGVPQTRTRRILMASRVQRVSPPEPTHAQYPEGADLFGGGHREPWVSMAEALGWGFEDEPSCTVSSGGAATGGAEPFANAGYRARLARYMGDVRSTNGAVRSVEQPSPTLTVSMDNGNFRWTTARPATTVAGDPRIAKPGHRDRAGGERQHAESIRITVQEAGILQSFPPDYPWQGTRTKRHEQVGNAVPPLLAAHVLRAVGAVARQEAAA